MCFQHLSFNCTVILILYSAWRQVLWFYWYYACGMLGLICICCLRECGQGLGQSMKTLHNNGSMQDKKFQCINSLRPSDAYMHQQIRPSLVEIMACRLVGAKPLSEPMLEYCKYSNLTNKLQSNLKRNSYIFIQENSFENVVWKMAAILSQPQCVNQLPVELALAVIHPYMMSSLFGKNLVKARIYTGPNYTHLTQRHLDKSSKFCKFFLLF